MNAPLQYRKKPVVIEAMHWDGTAASATPIIDWALANGGSMSYACPAKCPGTDEGHTLRVATLEGEMTGQPGDFIIRGVQGEFYPCKPDIFAATYEAEPTPAPEVPGVEVVKLSDDPVSYLVAGTLSVGVAREQLTEWAERTFAGRPRLLKRALEVIAELGQVSRTDWVWVPESDTEEIRLDYAGSDPEAFAAAVVFPGVKFQ